MLLAPVCCCFIGATGATGIFTIDGRLFRRSRLPAEVSAAKARCSASEPAHWSSIDRWGSRGDRLGEPSRRSALLHTHTHWCPIGRACSIMPVLSSTLYNHTHTHPFNDLLSGTTRVSRYQKGKTNLDFTEARDSEWQWHQLGRRQVYTLLQTENHASTPPLSVLQAGCPSCRPTNSVKAVSTLLRTTIIFQFTRMRWPSDQANCIYV